MRERYYRMYESIKFKEEFYEIHARRADKLYNIFTSLTLLISIVSVLIWSISKSMPVLWAAVIAVAQFAQAYSVNLPYAKQIYALHYLLPELRILLIEIDSDWLLLDINNYDEQKIKELISKHDSEFTRLENLFVGDINFCQTEKILNQAESGTTDYFKARYTYTTTKREENTDDNQSEHSYQIAPGPTENNL